MVVIKSKKILLRLENFGKRNIIDRPLADFCKDRV